MSERFRKLRPVAGLAVLATAIVAFPLLVSNPYYLNVVNIIGLNTIIVVGLNLLIGYAGQISLGHAAFYGLGAYISGILTVTYGVSPWIAMCVAVCATALLAMSIGIPTLKLHGHYLVMATLGFNLIVNIIIIQWDSVTGGPSGFPGIPSLAVGSWAFDTDRKMYYLIWGVAFASIVLALNLVNSRVGRGLRALHGSEPAASAVGVRTGRYKVKVFVLSAVFASLAGSLYAHYLTFISPKTFDIFFSIELVTMVIVGGMGSIWGALIGTMFLTPLPNILHFFDEYKDIFYGLILVLILIFVPEGLVVRAGKRWMTGRTNAKEEAMEEPLQAISVKAQSIVNMASLTDREAAQQTSTTVSPAPGKGKETGLPSAHDGFPRFGPMLAVEEVDVSFGGILALARVSFHLAQGSITALIGPNGAGKTTLINVVAGIYRAQHGRVFFAGQEVEGRPPYEMAALGLTRTFQNLQVFENMTVLENVMVGLHAATKNEFLCSMFHLRGFREEERRIEERAWEALRFFHLESKGHLLASSLSFGQQKRLEMARAFAPKPRLMLLDEPVAGLNMTETGEIARLICDMRSQGISVLLVEHDMNLVMSISDKIVVLNYGSKIAEGNPQEIQKDEQVLAAYLGGAA